ncbi:ABC transporter ATP-binding protein [Zoogloea sp. LCSB751]|uniref:ABC transporter ATP-binding protein n=1 Tax=Zoogloea sp. LCSB751 TaxID=1965277 RepID=UPI001C1F8982|nr:ABC transporter ATP-binding protein [Zoogloea sp. LCSB751]
MRPTDMAIALRGVIKRYGDFCALDGVSLDVNPGEFVSLLGPSGSGKSTILGLVVGSVLPDRGAVYIHGKDAAALRPHERNIGMVFQQYSLFPHLTVAENIAYPLKLRKWTEPAIKSRVAAFLDLVGLIREADRYPGEISGGQAQRVAVARALVFDPDVLLMDEPLGALDKRLRGELQEEFRRIQRETGVPTLYVTHDQDEAMFLSDRIIVCNQGRIVADGSPRDLYERPPGAWAAEFLGDANLVPVQRWRQCGDGQAKAETAWGEVVVPHAPGSTPERSAAIVVRPEHLLVAVDEPSTQGYAPARGGVRARVTSSVYLGGRQRIHLHTEEGMLLKAEVSGRRHLPTGGVLSIHWRPEDSWLVNI